MKKPVVTAIVISASLGVLVLLGILVFAPSILRYFHSELDFQAEWVRAQIEAKHIQEHVAQDRRFADVTAIGVYSYVPDGLGIRRSRAVNISIFGDVWAIDVPDLKMAVRSRKPSVHVRWIIRIFEAGETMP